MSYQPNKWAILKISPVDKEPWYRLFAGWYGGYTEGDSWRLNSGITGVELDGNFYLVSGESGSEYKCSLSGEGMSGYMESVLDSFRYSAADKAVIEVISMKDYLETV